MPPSHPLTEWLSDFVGLIYPNLCICCSTNLMKGEQFVCSHCLYDLPKTGFYKEPGNPVERMFWGRVMVEYAAANYFFKKGNRVQTVIHQIKYRGQKEMGEYFGKEMGKNLHPTSFSLVDMIAPVPLHPDKLKKRGYNQSEWIARGVCAELGKPLDNSTLVRHAAATTQTRKKRYERWENVELGFGLSNPESFAGKHILLIDDVITTGATLEACIRAAQCAENVKISVAALAVASS